MHFRRFSLSNASKSWFISYCFLSSSSALLLFFLCAFSPHFLPNSRDISSFSNRHHHTFLLRSLFFATNFSSFSCGAEINFAVGIRKKYCTCAKDFHVFPFVRLTRPLSIADTCTSSKRIGRSRFSPNSLSHLVTLLSIAAPSSDAIHGSLKRREERGEKERRCKKALRNCVWLLNWWVSAPLTFS